MVGWSFFFIIAMYALGLTQPAVAKLLYLGECALPQDPEEGVPTFVGCGHAQAGADALVMGKRRPSGVASAEGDLSLHAYSVLSLAGKWSAERSLYEPQAIERRAEYAYVRAGNPALHKFGLSAGILPLEFGLKRSILLRSYARQIPDHYWQNSELGLRLSYDDLRRFKMEVGYHVPDDYFDKRGDRGASQSYQAAFRTAYDFSALGGSRLMASLFSGSDELKGVSGGFVVADGSGYEAAFEVVRNFASERWTLAPDEQLIRFSVRSAYQASSRWVFQFDEHANNIRFGVLGYERQFFGHLYSKLHIGYQVSQVIAEDSWFAGLRLECAL